MKNYPHSWVGKYWPEVPPVVDNWILKTGFWNDAGLWDDSKFWID